MNMIRHLFAIWLPILGMTAIGGVAGAKESFSACQAPKGSFSTICPSSWNKLPFDDTINIISFPLSQREEGSVIKHGGAQIIVSEHKLAGSSVTDWIRKDNAGTLTLSRRIGGRYVRNGVCSKIHYIEVDVNQGSPPPELDSQIYCVIGGSIFKFQLRFWANDPKYRTYKAILETMFENFRIK